MKRFEIPAVLEGITARKDGGLSLRFSTNEINAEGKVLVHEYHQKFGWLLFAEQQHSDDLELEQVRRDTGGKTPSQRLRAVIYVLYQQSGQHDVTFEQFYAREMERHIEYVKQNLRD